MKTKVVTVLSLLLLSIPLVLTAAVSSWYTIYGYVEDEVEDPVIGASVIVTNDKFENPNGTLTDYQGTYILGVNALYWNSQVGRFCSNVHISYIGYQPELIIVPLLHRTINVEVQLTPDILE